MSERPPPSPPPSPSLIQGELKVSTAAAFVDALAAGGRYTFTTGQLQAELGISPRAAQASLRRLRTRREIATPLRGFHVVLPPEYRGLGCLPASHFMHDLMQRSGLPYYAALLSAAELHGAAHHRPQVFQVMVPAPRHPIRCGQVRAEFLMRANTSEIPATTVNTPHGVLRVSTPEATAFDLVGYVHRCGGFDPVVTVLSELADHLHARKLAEVAMFSPVSWSQRLGAILDVLGRSSLTAILARWVEEKDADPTRLLSDHPVEGTPWDPRWRVHLNADLEPEA